MKRLILCSEANQIDLVDFLQKSGHQPTKIRNNDYWYLSPFREENTPSFKVNRKLNIWYDHGIGKGGNFVDFGIQFYNCSISEFLQKLEGKTAVDFSFHQHVYPLQKPPNAGEKKIIVIAATTITSPTLCSYLRRRKIALDICNTYLKEVLFELNGKHHRALGFKNNSGGFELRNEYFKGSSSPKDVTIIGNENAQNIAAFEGFFSFLSYLNLSLKTKQENHINLPEGHTHFIILNSLSFFEKSRNIMEKHASINLYLDRDTAGIKATQQALSWSQKYKDQSTFYSKHKDLNEFLMQVQKPQQKQSLGRGRHF